ncbi:MAG: hypothetical protein ACLFTT_12140 [Candidatus Hydrogenedentota bacterium]
MSQRYHWAIVFAAIGVLMLTACLPGEPPHENNAQEQSSSPSPPQEKSEERAPLPPPSSPPAQEKPVQEKPAQEKPAQEKPAQEKPAQESSEEVANPPNPAASAEDDDSESTTQTADIYMPSFETARTEGVNAQVRRWPAEKGSGFEVTGSFDLTGVIEQVPDSENEWVFKGELTFPTSGYSLGEIQHQPQGVGTLLLSLPIDFPDPDAMAAQVLDTQSFEYHLKAQEETNFIVMFAQN